VPRRLGADAQPTIVASIQSVLEVVPLSHFGRTIMQKDMSAVKSIEKYEGMPLHGHKFKPHGYRAYKAGIDCPHLLGSK
jgi:hypothetical protein